MIARFDGADVDERDERLRALCAELDITWLERATVVRDGVRFIGTTLWADFDALVELPTFSRLGATLAAVARDLAGDGVIPHPLPLVALARWKGVDRAIKAGNYEFHSGITLPQLLSKLTQGDVTQTSLTVVEGATFADFARTLRDSRDVTKSVLDLPHADLLTKLGIDAPHPEGQFFPDTYFFAAGASDMTLLTRAHRLLVDRLDAARVVGEEVRAFEIRVAQIRLREIRDLEVGALQVGA